MLNSTEPNKFSIRKMFNRDSTRNKAAMQKFSSNKEKSNLNNIRDREQFYLLMETLKKKEDK